MKGVTFLETEDPRNAALLISSHMRLRAIAESVRSQQLEAVLCFTLALN